MSHDKISFFISRGETITIIWFLGLPLKRTIGCDSFAITFQHSILDFILKENDIFWVFMELYCRKLSFFTHLLCHSKNTIFSNCIYLYFVLLSELKHLSLLSQYDRTLGSWSALLHFLDFISKENCNCLVFLDSHWRGRSAWTEEGVRGFSIRHPPSEASCPTLLSTCTCLNISPAPHPLRFLNREHLSTCTWLNL